MTLTAQLAELPVCLDKVLADGLDAVLREGGWDEFELGQSFQDLLNLSLHKDACYDRPSTGWAYAAWYHGRRTHEALRLLAAVLPGKTGTVSLVDLGGGTGATLWALAALHHAAARADVSLPVVRVTLIDASDSMLRTAESLWQRLAESELADAAAAVQVQFVLSSWTDLKGLDLPPADEGLLFGGYLFDDSDKPRAAAVGRLLHDAADAVGAHELLFVTSWRKASIVDAAQQELMAAEWAVAPAAPLRPVWGGELSEVHAHRVEAYADVPAARRFRLPPCWTDQYQPRFHRFRLERHTGRLFEPVSDRGLAVDERQDEAARPDDRMTVIVGAAGSGKSVVLVERLARTVRQWPRQRGPLKVLVTTFNKEMIGRLAEWFGEAMGTRATGGAGDFSWRSPYGWAEVRFLNWDKVPAHLLRVPPCASQWTEDRVKERLAQLGRTWDQLTAPQQEVLDPAFLHEELRRVLYGLDVWATWEDYQGLANRHGRRRQISEQQKRLVWDVGRNGGVHTWTHYRRAGLEKARLLPESPFTHVFIDECQDFTPADFEFASYLVPDPNRMVAAGDEAQSMHLGASYRRPGQVPIPPQYRSESQPAFRLWSVQPLDASYRLPVRICEAISPLAERLEADRTGRGGEHDVSLPRAKKEALLGVRPIIVAERDWQQSLAGVFRAFPRLLQAAPAHARTVTIAEAGLAAANMPPLPAGYDVRSESMRAIKGLERACMVWRTSAPLPAHENEIEWVYTIITRSTALAVIVVDAQETTHAIRAALKLLPEDRVLCWNKAAADEFAACRA